MSIKIDGKQLSQDIKKEIKEKVQWHVENGGKKPHLAAVLVGDNTASRTYVRGKVKSCKNVGFTSSLIEKDKDISESELLDVVKELNENEDIDGYIVQLPLPDHIDENKINLAIDPEKDVDGFHPTNLGKMMIGLDTYLPATPYGILQMLERYKIETEGKHAVVIGRSQIVGTPLSVLLSRKRKNGNATVTLVHSRTQNLKELCKSADIIVAAIGKANFVTEDMVKTDAVVIDVGINRVEDSSKKKGYRLVGDVDYNAVSKKASYITPVPGGVGPMTITSLLLNTFKAAEKKGKV